MKTGWRIVALKIVLTASSIAGAGSGEENRDTMDALNQAVSRIEPMLKGKSPQLKEEFNHFLFGEVAHAWLVMGNNDPKHPDISPSFGTAFLKGVPNPDTVYYIIPVEDSGVYTLSGFRGTVNMMDAQIGNGHLMTRGAERKPGQTLRNYDIDELSIGDDGSFEVMLSAKRPDGFEGDWWELPKGATNILFRQLAEDWINEVDGRVAIDRIDLPVTRPRPKAHEIEETLNSIPQWVENWAIVNLEWIKTYVEPRAPVNTTTVVDWSGSGGIADQGYVEGVFEIEPHEALILEARIPKQCRYWSFQLADEFWRSIPWMDRQSSLNRKTAAVGSDGIFRAVISAKDPGVNNWLDTAGYSKGQILGRWLECNEYPNAVVTRVDFAELPERLPENTVYVSPEQREQALRLRKKGAQLRRRW